MLNIFLAFSQATFNAFIAFLSFLIFLAFSASSILLKTISTNSLSKSSPPKFVSPAVAKTSNLVEFVFLSFCKERIETSNVPPPKSNIKILQFKSFFLSKP